MSCAPAEAIRDHGDLAVNLASFARHLRAASVSPRTVQAYSEAVAQLATFLAEQGMPGDVADISGGSTSRRSSSDS